MKFFLAGSASPQCGQARLTDLYFYIFIKPTGLRSGGRLIDQIVWLANRRGEPLRTAAWPSRRDELETHNDFGV
jgi:hypothetical protein